MRCPICFEAKPVDPLLCPCCWASYCGGCLLRWTEREPRCPQCRAAVGAGDLVGADEAAVGARAHLRVAADAVRARQELLAFESATLSATCERQVLRLQLALERYRADAARARLPIERGLREAATRARELDRAGAALGAGSVAEARRVAAACERWAGREPAASFVRAGAALERTEGRVVVRSSAVISHRVWQMAVCELPRGVRAYVRLAADPRGRPPVEQEWRVRFGRPAAVRAVTAEFAAGSDWVAVGGRVDTEAGGAAGGWRAVFEARHGAANGSLYPAGEEDGAAPPLLSSAPPSSRSYSPAPPSSTSSGAARPSASHMRR